MRGIKYVFWLFPWAMFFVRDNKMFLAVFLALMIFLRLRGMAYDKVVFFLLLMAIPFERGFRGWMVPVVGADNWMASSSGYSFYFGLSIKMFLLILLTGWNIRKIVDFVKVDRSVWWLGGFLIWSVVSCLVCGFTWVTVLGLVKIVYLFFLFLIAKINWKDGNTRFWFRNLVIGWLVFFGTLGVAQFIGQNYIGLYIEEGSDISRFGYLTNESQFLYRVAGVMGHPTFFASWLSMILSAGFGMFLSYFDKKTETVTLGKRFLMIGFGLSLMALIATYSRSSWLATAMSGLFLLIIYFKKGNFNILMKGMKWMLVVGLIIVWFYGGYLVKRLESFDNIFTLGSGRGRLELVGEAVNMIKNNPIFGVGLNRFTEAMVKQNISGAAEYFLYPVHNTWILFASETGLPSMILWTVFVFVILRKIPTKIMIMGVWLGALSFVFNSQFHTLFSQDPSIDLFIVMLAYLDSI